MTMCLVFLTGLMIGTSLGLLTACIFISAKKGDSGLQHESDAVPYTRYYE